MTDEAAFIQTIREHPDDDGPRLVYADWLEEHGQSERAEFIRVQIELTRNSTNPLLQHRLRAREVALLEKYEKQWSDVLGEGVRGCEFRRGMVESIEIAASVLQDSANEIFDRAPIVRVHIRGRSSEIVRLAECESLGRLRELDLSGNYLLLWQLRPLLESPFVVQLQSLDLSSNHLADDDIQDLTRTPIAANLKHLGLAGVLLRGGEWIRGCQRLPNLIGLRLGSNQLGDAGVEILSRNSNLQSIRRLDLSHCEFGIRGAQAIASSKRLARLTELDLSANPIGDVGAESLANSRLLNGLESLSLRDCDIGWLGAKAIAQSQMLEGLKHLDLSGNRLNSRQQNRLELRFGSRVKF